MEGKTKTIGLVLESIGEQRFKGYFAKLKTGIVIDEFSHLTLREEIIRTNFWCKPSTGQYKTDADTFEEAIEVGRQLKKIGIDSLKLIFNDKEYPTKTWLG